MTSSNLRSLDELLRTRFDGAIAEPPPGDWDDVRLRAAGEGDVQLPARLGRRSAVVFFAAAAAAVAAAVITAPALGIGGGVIDFFGSKPASSQARAVFLRMNVAGPGRSALGATAEPRQIYVFRLASGDHTLSLAVDDSVPGGFCWAITDFTNGCQTIMSSHGPYKAGEVAPIKIGLVYTDIPTPAMQQTPVLVGGDVRAPGAASLRVEFEDGSATTVPLIWVSRPLDAGFFLYELPRNRWSAGKRPIAVAALASNGDVLARATFDVASTLEESAGVSR